MSLNCLSGPNIIPFFPPGIASHKSTSFRRPQSVKECKKLSKNKFDKPKSGFISNKRLSTSTPNIMLYVSSSDHLYTIPKHRCDMGLLENYRFKANPLPQCYSSNSLERNKSLFEQLNVGHKTYSVGRISNIPSKSNSLDRMSRTKFKTFTNFVPIRPFYPPSKYPNIQDKTNINLVRLLETRKQYKTPKSRKSLSLSNKNKSKDHKNENLSTNIFNMSESVPNLIIPKPKKISNNKGKNSDLDKLFKNNKDQTDYSPEIGLYRKSDKLDLQDEFGSFIPKQMSASYFYPKPITNPSYAEYSDKMTQSLYNESSLAAKIQTGSLERATRNINYTPDNENKIEMTDLVETPSKSYSPIKQCNSFSQDSLDGNKKHLLNQNNVNALKTESETTDSLVESERIYNSNTEDLSIIQDTQTYKFHSPNEDDVSLSKIENYNKFLNSLSTISEKAKSSEDLKNDFLMNQSNINRNTNSVQPIKNIHLENENKGISNGDSNVNYNEDSENTSFIIDSQNNKIYSPTSDNLQLTEIENNSKYINYSSRILEEDKVNNFEKKNILLNDHIQIHIANQKIKNDEKSIYEDEIYYNNSENNSLNRTLKENKYQSQTENLSINKNGSMLSDKIDYNNSENNSLNRTLKENKYQSENENISINKNGSMISNYKDTNKNEEKTFEDQYNSNRYIMDSQVLLDSNRSLVFVSSSALSIQNEFFSVPNTLTIEKENQMILNNIASKCIVSSNQIFDNTQSWKKEECILNDKIIVGKPITLQQDQGKVNEIDSTRSTVYSPNNTQVSGLDYDFNDMGFPNHLINETKQSHFQIPRIEFQSNVPKSVDDFSSENESSLSGSDDTSYLRYEYNSVSLSQPGKSWVSSPELTVARSDIISRKHRRHLQSENPLKPLCNICFKPAYFMERISINNIIFHKMCFLCRKCDTHLSFNNCIIHRRKPYCLVHAKPKISKTRRSVSTSKLSQIKEKLDNKSNLQKQLTTDPKQPKRVFYSGIKSAKEKFLQDKLTVKEPVLRQPKRFTPPRDGVNSGVLESEPKPRDPNIVISGDSFDEDLTRLSHSHSTKERLARFKEIQEKDFNPKDMVNGNDSDHQKPEVISVDTKMLRNKFLSGTNEINSESKSKKINPMEEIQELTRKDSNMVYENEPLIRNDVIKSDQKYDDENMFSKNKAKEMKDLFSNYPADNKPKKTEKFQMETGEGGIYESFPQERNDEIFLCKSEKPDNDFNLPNDSVKTGLQKIKDLQNLKSQGYQKSNSESFKLDIDPNHSGIYENIPAESHADSISNDNEEYLANIRDKKYANEAKKAYLEKQKHEEESRIKQNTPEMIDIWKDLCVYSGVFENKPVPQNKDVVRCNDKQEEELIVEQEEIDQEDFETKSN